MIDQKSHYSTDIDEICVVLLTRLRHANVLLLYPGKSSILGTEPHTFSCETLTLLLLPQGVRQTVGRSRVVLAVQRRSFAMSRLCCD
jgi:hypothetical protein